MPSGEAHRKHGETNVHLFEIGEYAVPDPQVFVDIWWHLVSERFIASWPRKVVETQPFASICGMLRDGGHENVGLDMELFVPSISGCHCHDDVQRKSAAPLQAGLDEFHGTETWIMADIGPKTRTAQRERATALRDVG